MYHLKYAYLYTGLVQSRIKPEEEFNLINMPVLLTAGNGRVYDPLLARFLNADPFIQDNTDAQNYNHYSYVLNNPTKYTDPSGYAYNGIGSSYRIGGMSDAAMASMSHDIMMDYGAYWGEFFNTPKEQSGGPSAGVNEYVESSTEDLGGILPPLYIYANKKLHFSERWASGSTGAMQARNGDASPYYQNQGKYTGQENNFFTSIDHNNVDKTVTVVGGMQNMLAWCAESSEIMSKAVAKRVAFVGVAYTAIDIYHALETGNLNTSHKIDGTMTAILAGVALFNPIGLTALTVYGGFRLIGGAAFDDYINRKF